jgi:hypothetical protein
MAMMAVADVQATKVVPAKLAIRAALAIKAVKATTLLAQPANIATPIQTPVTSPA